MRPTRSAAWALALLCLLPAEVRAQWDVIGKAALPAVPYWWRISEGAKLEIAPLFWTNDVDGGGSGCCVVGAALRQPIGPATLWFGLGFGTAPAGGTPAAIEAAAEIRGGAVAYRNLHGRSGIAAFYPVRPWKGRAADGRISVGISSVRLHDQRYIEPLPFFECPDVGPVAPCETVDQPYPWSAGEDNALAAEVEWGRGEWGAPRLSGSLLVGVKVAGGDYGYLRAELAARVGGGDRRLGWTARLAGGWASGGTPLQRRFLLYGADPIIRWLNPYLDVKGGLLADVPYFVPGGANLRPYEATQPLVKSYVGASGDISTGGETDSGFWGSVSAYLATAWTPGIPERLGPEALNEDGSFLFDWRELPQGEGEAGGRFRARVLQVSELWADAGFTLTGGYRRVAVTVSLPLYASEPAFASEPIGGGQKSAFALRGTLTIQFFPFGRPGS
jgi:hypothetical protein